jgi:group I intron endonuclease
MKNNKNNKNINYIVSPVIRYNNTDVDKYIILKENKNKSGVYRLVNNINGKSYVASSRSLSKKLNIYYSLSSLKRKNGSIIIYRALLKYGHSNFSLDILEYSEPSELIAREQYYIDYFKPEYNILKKS